MKIKTGIKVFVFLGAILTFSGSAFAKPTLRTSEFSQKTTQQKKNLENKFKDARERGWPLKDKMLKDQNQKDDRQRNQNQKDKNQKDKNQKDLKNDKQNQNKNKKTADDTSVIRTSSKTVSASDFELSIIAEVNLMRSNPREYAEKYIKPLINSRSSSYWTSCVRDMSAISSLGTLEYAEGLYKMAKAHSSTQGKTRETGHDRTNGSDFSSELNKYGKSYSYAGENISYGAETARDILIQLLVDDGVSSLGHRKNLLSKEFTAVGISYDTHKAYRHMCVMDFAKNWVDR